MFKKKTGEKGNNKYYKNIKNHSAEGRHSPTREILNVGKVTSCSKLAIYLLCVNSASVGENC